MELGISSVGTGKRFKHSKPMYHRDKFTKIHNGRTSHQKIGTTVPSKH
jgi:hypothetical protein